MNSTEDAYSDLGGGTAPSPPVHRDRHGMIDKSAPDDEEYPREWTPEQRVKSTWAKMQARRDQQEHDDALRYPSSLLTEPPASEETRARALQDFSNSQLSFADVDDDAPDEALLHINALLVPCPFCRSSVGEPCTKPGMPGRERDKLTDIPGHPARIVAAALAKGFSQEEADAFVLGATMRQTKRVRASWGARDVPPPPPEPRHQPPPPEVDTSAERGREIAESGVHAPPAEKPPAQPPSEMGWRDEKGRLHFPDSERLDRDFAKRYEKLFGTI